MSRFESEYRAKLNAKALMLLAAHLPACCVLAGFEDSGVLFALLISTLLLAGPVALFLTGRARLSTSIAMAISTMGFSALIIHLGHGMIELHFHIFTAIAMLTVFGSIWPVLAAAAVIAVHHIAFWLWLPASVFNYKASFGIVLIHAFFVIFETVPACYIALEFGRAIRKQAITREQLTGSAERVNQAAITIASQGEELASRASQQAATLEETSASSHEVSTTANKMAADTEQAVTVIDEADLRVANANQSLQLLQTSIGQLSSSSQQIANIIRVIDGIAFQTNILALNAAVEAARAGEAGQGFAVVADEVRSLAQRSAEAARNTAQLITVSVENARTSGQRTDEIAAAMSRVTESTISIRTLVSGIHSSGQEQAKVLIQISQALSRLEHMTQLNAASAEENATIGISLEKDANKLSSVVAELEAH